MPPGKLVSLGKRGDLSPEKVKDLQADKGIFDKHVFDGSGSVERIRVILFQPQKTWRGRGIQGSEAKWLLR